MNRTKTIFATILSFLPMVTLAAASNLGGLIKMATDLINPLIGLLSGLALLAFVWGIVQYIFYASDEKKKLSAKNTMVYGVIGLFVLFSFWGIVQFIKKDIFG